MNRSLPTRRGVIAGAGIAALAPRAFADSPQSKVPLVRSRDLVFVHGIFGWGPGELGPLPYWGKALSQFDKAFKIHEAKCGPVSSFHDRACELFAQIRGGSVDYGKEHSDAAGHDQFSSKLNFGGFVKNWSAANPVILIAHSAGAHTCLQLQALLAQDYWKVGSNADWIDAIVCVAGVLNGSTLTYHFGCDKDTGLLTGAPSVLIDAAVNVSDWTNKIGLPISLPGWVPTFKVDPWLDHWKGNTGAFVSGKDNLAYDLTLQGCYAANQCFQSNTNTLYLSLVTGEEETEYFGHKTWGDMNVLLRDAATYQKYEIDFQGAPIPDWGTTDDLKIEPWQRTDGAVSSISQRYPFTHHKEPVGGEGIFNRASIDRGKWYFEPVENAVLQRFDHLDPVAGVFFKSRVWGPHEKLYQMLSAKLLGV